MKIKIQFNHLASNSMSLSVTQIPHHNMLVGQKLIVSSAPMFLSWDPLKLLKIMEDPSNFFYCELYLSVFPMLEIKSELKIFT